MNHIRALFLLHVLPRDIRNVLERRSHRIVVVLPSNAFQDRVRLGQRFKLEFRRLSPSAKCDTFRETLFSMYLFLPAIQAILTPVQRNNHHKEAENTHNREIILRQYLLRLLLLLGILQSISLALNCCPPSSQPHLLPLNIPLPPVPLLLEIRFLPLDLERLVIRFRGRHRAPFVQLYTAQVLVSCVLPKYEPTRAAGASAVSISPPHMPA